MPFNFPYFESFYIQGLADPGETALLRAGWFPEVVNNSPGRASSVGKPTNAHTQATTLSSSHTSNHYFTALNISGPDNKQLGTALMPQSLLKLFTLDNPKPIYPASLAPSCGNHVFCHVFLLFPLPPDWPWCFPLWPLCGTCAPSSWEL